jgi:cytochrome c2
VRRALPLLLLLAACGEAETPAEFAVPGADPARGRELTIAYGCGSCHVIEGVPGARGLVGPPLVDFALRTSFAGAYPNVPEHLVPFLVNPPAYAPDTGMPVMGLDTTEAADVAAFLYTLGASEAEAVQRWQAQVPAPDPQP